MRISCIIPTYNRAILLPLTLRSLLAQTLPAAEILVVDDGSTDGTAEVAESFGGSVRVIRQANAGPAAARNRGFKESVGEFIHFFDSDDLALPNKHEVQLRALERSAADIAYGPWVKGRITNDGFDPENAVLQQHGLPDGDLVKALLSCWSIVPHACLFRRSVVERVGGFPQHLRVAEDQLMFLKCLLAGAKVVHSPGTLELYRSNGSGKLTADDVRSKARHFLDWARFLCMARTECLKRGIDPKIWYGFRARAWQAHQDLATSDEHALLKSLEAVFQAERPKMPYPLHQFATRKFGGLKARLTGTRAHASFRTGTINAAQQALIEQLDFTH